MPESVVFVDTSVLCRMMGLDGDERAREVAEEVEARKERGEHLIIPISTIIEAGNHIAQARGHRRRLAARLVSVIEAAMGSDPPWVIRRVSWDEDFLAQLIGGDSTGVDLISLLGDGRMGTGDVAILVERDRFKRETAFSSCEVWTFDEELRAYGS